MEENDSSRVPTAADQGATCSTHRVTTVNDSTALLPGTRDDDSDTGKDVPNTGDDIADTGDDFSNTGDDIADTRLVSESCTLRGDAPSIEIDLVSDHINRDHSITKFSILKNFTILCASFVIIIAAFVGLVALQSTINKAEGLGTIGLAMTYVSAILTGMFLAPALITGIGCKWTMVLSMVCYDCYIAANIYPTWATIVPGSLIGGIGVSSLFAAEMAYVNQLGICYSKITGLAEKVAMSRFAGVFVGALMSSVVVGNLFSSLYLNRESTANTTVVTNFSSLACGADFCPYAETNSSRTQFVDAKQIQIMSIICLAVGCLSVLLMAILMDPLRTEDEMQEFVCSRFFSTKKLVSTLKHLRNSRYQKMLVPISMYRGIGTAFLVSDFTVSAVSCPYGVGNVGFVMIAYGASSSVFATLFGHVVKYTGKILIFLIAWCCEASVLVTLLLWKPLPGAIYVVYIMSGLWGVGDAVFRSTLFTVYAGIFTEDKPTAFSTHMFLEGIGFSIAFAYSAFLCTRTKIYINLVCLCVAIAMVILVKVLVGRSNKKQAESLELNVEMK